VANIQGILLLAKSGVSDAEITKMRDAMVASALNGRSEMKIISSEVHVASTI